ncbi:hypothetical protein CRI93_09385 [Longimonas halophila]|uniref:Uncharacterized protein n=1 Tax=Longimonas halophila TaxID=1469170 RepID=A0A2H3NKM1_9BACT|nr:hypothetical protein CRI93_09385 [Longimonas halophila]
MRQASAESKDLLHVQHNACVLSISWIPDQVRDDLTRKLLPTPAPLVARLCLVTPNQEALPPQALGDAGTLIKSLRAYLDFLLWPTQEYVLYPRLSVSGRSEQPQ